MSTPIAVSLLILFLPLIILAALFYFSPAGQSEPNWGTAQFGTPCLGIGSLPHSVIKPLFLRLSLVCPLQVVSTSCSDSHSVRVLYYSSTPGINLSRSSD
jgi:hypothetical protein